VVCEGAEGVDENGGGLVCVVACLIVNPSRRFGVDDAKVRLEEGRGNIAGV
jgi:hypothetical protein